MIVKFVDNGLGIVIEKHYNDCGELVAEAWIGTCPSCGERRLRRFRLSDGTSGYDNCCECGYHNEW